MWDAMNESTPKKLEEGEWHIPFGPKWDHVKIAEAFGLNVRIQEDLDKVNNELYIQIATARCARVSYGNFEGKDDYEADINLYERLSTSGHYSPFEHCAKVMTKDEYIKFSHSFITKGKAITEHGWCRNFRGFIQLRNDID